MLRRALNERAKKPVAASVMNQVLVMMCPLA